VLYFVETYFATHYLLLTFITSLGTLQLVAARYGWRGLSLVEKPFWSGWGYILGSSLVAGGFTWFFLTTPNLLSPGPAGSELMLLMGLGTAGALVFTLSWTSIREKIRARKGNPLPAPDINVRGLDLLREMSIWQAWQQTRKLTVQSRPLEVQ
jgi:hypothetical protein